MTRVAPSLWLAWLLLAAFLTRGEPLAAEPDPTVSARLAREAMHLLHRQCLACHNDEKRKGGLRLTSREALAEGGESGPVLHPSSPAESRLLAVLAEDADPHMPPKGQLAPPEIALLTEWVAAGVPWDAAALREGAARQVTLTRLPPGLQPSLALAISADATRLAVGRGDHIFVFDLASTNFPLLKAYPAHSEWVRSLAWNPEGTLLASGSFRELKVWQADSFTLQRAVSSNLLGRIEWAQFTPHGGALAVAESAPAESGRVRLYSTASWREISSWTGHRDSILQMALTRDGGLLATAGADHLVRLWETVSGRETGQIEAHAGAVLGLAFNPDGTELVTVGQDKQLKLWDVATRQSLVTIGGRKRSFTSVAWSGDGKTVVAADEEGQLTRLTDFKRHTGEQSSETAREHSLGRWPETLHAVAVSREASRIAAAGESGRVYLVDFEGKLLQKFEITAEPPLAQAQTQAQTEVEGAKPLSFVRDVLPVLAKAGCMAGSCHAKAEGQNGFKLSVFSFDPKSDFFEITQEARGRRTFPAAPEESLLLLKPTLAVPHEGGQRIERDSETYRTLAAWIRGGMAYQVPNEPILERIAVEPNSRTLARAESDTLRVVAHYSDGSTREVTALADFSSNDRELAQVSDRGRVQTGELPGECVIIARFMGFVDACRITIPAEQLPAGQYAAWPAHNFVDRLANEQFQRLGLFPSELCSDAEFLRRASLDTIGMLPTPAETREFLASTEPGKRKRWIEQRLDHPAYADYWANKWTDLLRPNPDRVGVKSILFLDQWIRAAFRANLPYDQFARQILLAEGRNHQEGPATIYRDRREPPELATFFSQLFLGVRMECAKCHHHPNEKWSQDDFYQLAAYFGPLKQKGAGLSPPISAGTETFYFARGGTVQHPVTGAVMRPRPLDATGSGLGESAASADPRGALADWMTAPGNPFFARAAVNRVWAAFFGRGFVEPVDDFRVSNPASQEPLLDALARDFVQHGFDLKHLMRTILNSRLYQLSSLPNAHNLADTRNYARAYRRRLPAEVLLDAVNDVTQTTDEFNGCPPGTRAIQTWSYKVRSHFLDAFGRPNSSSDCPCERDVRSSVVQSLHMMNSRALQAKLADPQGRVKKLADSPLPEDQMVVELYLAALSRFPASDELGQALRAFSAPAATRQTGAEDVLWALLNSAEFVFNH